MDSNQFDAFVLSIGGAIPRRAALVGALGMGLAGLLTRLGIEDAQAKKKKRKKCKSGKKKCGKKCVDLATDPLNCGACGNACATAECFHGACGCDTDGNDCPDLCGCATRVEGGSACAAKPVGSVACDTDDDCPLGAICFLSDGSSFCSGTCQG